MSVPFPLSSFAFSFALALGFTLGAAPPALAQAGGARAAETAGAVSSSAAAGQVRIENGWMRATAPGQNVGGGFLTLDNRGPADRLLGASSPVAESVELHTMSMDNNVMRMREVSSVDLPAGQTVVLRPGGVHLMFLDLKAPLKAGETVPVTLRFEKAGEVAVSLQVEAMGAMRAGQADHGGPGAEGAHGESSAHGGHGGGDGRGAQGDRAAGDARR